MPYNKKPIPKSHHLLHGFSLIELIIVIVCLGLLLTGVTRSMITANESSATSTQQFTAIDLAEKRLELILQQKTRLGFSNFTVSNFDPCQLVSPPAFCTPPTGYVVAATLQDQTIAGDTRYKIITVTISGKGDTTLKSLVSGALDAA